MTPSKQIAYRTFAEIAGRLCSFGLVVLAARTLDTPVFGVFSLAWASGWLLSIAADFGLQLHSSRQVALRPEDAGSVFRRRLPVRLLVLAALAAAAALLVRQGVEPAFRWPVFAIVASHLVTSLIDFCNHFFRGLGRSDWEASVTLLQRGAALLIAAAWTLLSPGLAAFAGALQLSAWLALGAARPLVSGQVLPRTAPASKEPSPAAGVFAIGLGILLSALYFRLDLFVLETSWGSRQVGLYNAVFRLVDAARLFPAAVLAVVFPLLCRPGHGRVFRRALAGLTGLSLLLLAGGWVLAAAAVPLLYGDAFREAVPIFRLLLLSLPLLFVNFLLTHQLIARGRERAYAGVCAAGLAASLVLTLSLVPPLAGEGAAWACLGREGLISAGCFWMLKGDRE